MYMARKLIAQGAEANLYKDGAVLVKDRIPKRYRIAEIDNKLRGYRTRREAKVLATLQKTGFPAPRLFQQDEKQTIVMDFIKGPRVRDILEKVDYVKVSKEIGEKVAELHNMTIIHGDLTTSNMILHEKKVYFIDFGLSFFSHKAEDKAVDLHLLKEGLESKHYKVWQESFQAALEAYKKKAKDGAAVLERLAQVEKRGRYKRKGKGEI